MKLIFCDECGDVQRLVAAEWRKCACGRSGGQYNTDQMTATIGGIARVFGIGNPFFNEFWSLLDAHAKEMVRRKWGYGGDNNSASWKQIGTDCWWGDYPGEQQLFHIDSPEGPRLKVRVKEAPSTLGKDRSLERSFTNQVFIVDKRRYVIDGIEGVKFVTVPGNPKPGFKGKK